MDGTRITILDEHNNEAHVANERLEVDGTRIDTIKEQTYTIPLGGKVGRKVKFQTDETNPNGRKILIVESWAEVQRDIEDGE